jgi:hypothetical protein
MSDGYLDEAYERLRETGPEFDGWLANHAPMAVEVLTRRGSGELTHRWIDQYVDGLEPRPRGISPIDAEDWRDPLGDPVRTGDWLDYFERAVTDRPWRDVPRCPGPAAATSP